LHILSVYRLGAALAALATAIPALAEDGAAAPANDIIVTAARTQLPASALPLTVRILDAGTLQRQLIVSGSVVDAVSALVPSFSPARQKLTGQGETLRGRSPLFAVDGIPQTAPLRDGSRDGFTIDPFFIDRVEIIQGSNALQGIGATGGVINQVTVVAPEADGWSGRVLLQGTAEDGFPSDGLGFKVAGLLSHRTGAFDLTVGAAYEQRGTYRDGKGRRIAVEATQGDLQDSNSLGLFLRAGAALGEGVRLELMAQRFELQGNGDYIVVPGSRALGIPATGARGEQPGEAPRNLAESASLTLTADDLWGGDFSAQLFWNRTQDIYGGGVFADFRIPAFPPFGTLFDQSQNKSRKIGGRLTYERAMPGLEDLTLLAGLDVLQDRTVQTLIATDRAWVPETDYRSIAPFAQLNLALLDEKLRLSAGLRFEDVKITIPDYQTLWFYGPRDVTGGSPSFSETLPNAGSWWNHGTASAPMRAMPKAIPCPMSAASPAPSGRTG
jgi:iron complex outermembrane recepter protein